MSDENVPNQQEVRFYQIKSHFFRVIHADGIWASMGPFRHVHLTFYNERLPLPTEIVYPLMSGNRLGDEIADRRVTKKDWVREMEVDIVMTYDRAVEVHKWLGQYLALSAPQQPPKT